LRLKAQGGRVVTGKGSARPRARARRTACPRHSRRKDRGRAGPGRLRQLSMRGELPQRADAGRGRSIAGSEIVCRIHRSFESCHGSERAGDGRELVFLSPCLHVSAWPLDRAAVSSTRGARIVAMSSNTAVRETCSESRRSSFYTPSDTSHS